MTVVKDPQHTVVVGCLVRNNDELLLIRHHKRGWEIPQGRVEEGEGLMDALRREVLEEAGVKIHNVELAAVWSLVAQPSAIIMTFVAGYASGEPSGTDDSLEARWFKADEALDMVTSQVMRDRLKTLLEFSGKTVFRSYSVKPYQLLS